MKKTLLAIVFVCSMILVLSEAESMTDQIIIWTLGISTMYVTGRSLVKILNKEEEV